MALSRKHWGAGRYCSRSDGLLKYARRKDIAQVASAKTSTAQLRSWSGYPNSAPVMSPTTWTSPERKISLDPTMV